MPVQVEPNQRQCKPCTRLVTYSGAIAYGAARRCPHGSGAAYLPSPLRLHSARTLFFNANLSVLLTLVLGSVCIRSMRAGNL